MGNLVDFAKAIGLGVCSGLLIAAIAWKPVNKFIDRYEKDGYDRVWGGGSYDDRREDNGDVARLELAQEDGESRRDAVANGESLVDSTGIGEWQGNSLLPMVIPQGELPRDSSGISA